MTNLNIDDGQQSHSDLAIETRDNAGSSYTTKETAQRFEGVIKWFDTTKGYGFILHTSGKDVFVHKSQVSEIVDEGMKVTYVLVETDKGLRAVDVKRLVA